jgi:hypothetical protein
MIKQEGWTNLEDITLIAVDEVKDIQLLRGDGIHLGCPMMVHIRMFKAFLLYYKRRSRVRTFPHSEDDVLEYTKLVFNEYCRSDFYTEDVSTGGLSSTSMEKTAPQPYSSQSNSLTVQEFCRGVKRDKAHYENLKVDKYFNSWNHGFVATACMHHTELVFNEKYVPKNDDEKIVFKEMQFFMYAVFEEHLKTSKGKSLVSQYEETHDVQSIYRDLKKHALSSTAAQLSGDTLLQYSTTTRYPGNWRDTSYEFVLHWKEQVMKYERLELEDFPPKQKLHMLQNAVGDVTEVAYVKQIGDQDIARGNPPLKYENYMELLLSSCSTYDKKIALPGKQKRAVYTAKTSEVEPDRYYNVVRDDGYAVYSIDTDVSDIMVNTTNASRFGSTSTNSNSKSTFLPRD